MVARGFTEEESRTGSKERVMEFGKAGDEAAETTRLVSVEIMMAQHRVKLGSFIVSGGCCLMELFKCQQFRCDLKEYGQARSKGEVKRAFFFPLPLELIHYELVNDFAKLSLVMDQACKQGLADCNDQPSFAVCGRVPGGNPFPSMRPCLSWALRQSGEHHQRKIYYFL